MVPYDLNLLAIALALILAYLLGSIPAAYLAGRLIKGIDIRQVGTRNMGAMNVFYQIGFLAGLIVLAVDIGKGTAAIALAFWLGTPDIVVLLAGIAAVLGHSFPVWLRFRGGKGGATTIGVLIFLMPWGIPIGLAIFGLVLLLSRFPTLSYSVALVSFPFVAWLIYHNGVLVAYTIALLLIPALQYIPRVREIRSRSGSWRSALLRKNMKDRM